MVFPLSHGFSPWPFGLLLQASASQHSTTDSGGPLCRALELSCCTDPSSLLLCSANSSCLGYFLTPANVLCGHQLGDQQCNFDTNHSELGIKFPRCKTQFHKTAFISEASCKYQVTHISKRAAINWVFQ